MFDNRDKLIEFVDSLSDEARLSIAEIADQLGEKKNTVSGWLSDERNYPPSHRGARNQKFYDKNVITQLLLVYFANRQPGITVQVNHAYDRISRNGIGASLEALRSSSGDFFNVLQNQDA